MENRPDDSRFGPAPLREGEYLLGPFASDRANRVPYPNVGGRMPRSLRYLIDKAQALYDFVDDMLGRVRRKRNRR